MWATTRMGQFGFPLDGFLWNLIFEHVSKICRENSRLVKTLQELPVLYMKIHVHLWSYLAHFFLELKMFQIKGVEKIKTHILCTVTFSQKSCRLWDNVEKSTVERGRPQIKIWRMRIARWIPKTTNTHSEYVTLIPPSLQQWLRERAQLLRHTYVVCLAVHYSLCHQTLLSPSYRQCRYM
jgi:hypothetical protein